MNDLDEADAVMHGLGKPERCPHCDYSMQTMTLGGRELWCCPNFYCPVFYISGHPYPPGLRPGLTFHDTRYENERALLKKSQGQEP